MCPCFFHTYSLNPFDAIRQKQIQLPPTTLLHTQWLSSLILPFPVPPCQTFKLALPMVTMVCPPFKAQLTPNCPSAIRWYTPSSRKPSLKVLTNAPVRGSHGTNPSLLWHLPQLEFPLVCVSGRLMSGFPSSYVPEESHLFFTHCTLASSTMAGTRQVLSTFDKWTNEWTDRWIDRPNEEMGIWWIE